MQLSPTTDPLGLGRTSLDIIGDIHGHDATLRALLLKLGYTEGKAGFAHPQRIAVFVGDFIDRGPRQAEVVRTVQCMVEAGNALAVIGNHEYNAVAFATEDPNNAGRFLREHTPAALRQHKEFLRQVGGGSLLHRDILQWFTTLPLWLDLGGIRVVHACWDTDAMRTLQPLVGPNNNMTPELVETTSVAGTRESQALRNILKGPDIKVPIAYYDQDGNVRKKARVRWWDPEATTLDKAADMAGNELGLDGLVHPGFDPVPVALGVPIYADPVPLFFGHYWQPRKQIPIRQGPTAACVDYSAGKGGPLVAYQWNGEDVIDNNHFVRCENCD